MSAQEPGLDLHEWETRWAELEEELAEDPAGALSDACDLIEKMLGDTDWSDELERSFQAAREVADAIERDEDVDPGDVAAAIANLKGIREELRAGDAD